MDAELQKTFPFSLSCLKIVVFWLKIYCVFTRASVLVHKMAWYRTYGRWQFVFDGWVLAERSGRSTQQWVVVLSVRSWGPGFATCIQHMRQIAHYCLLCSQCMEACSHISLIQMYRFPGNRTVSFPRHLHIRFNDLQYLVFSQWRILSRKRQKNNLANKKIYS